VVLAAAVEATAWVPGSVPDSAPVSAILRAESPAAV